MKTMSKEATPFAFPPTYCSWACKNSMNEVCCTGCALTRDASGFEMRDDINLEDAPRFPTDKFIHGMTPGERTVQVAVYTALEVDHLKGIHHDYIIRRPHFNDPRSVKISQDQSGQGILHGPQETAPDTPFGPQHPSEDKRPVEVDQSAD